MDSMFLAKAKLEEGWIDCSIGEPYIIRDSLLKTFQLYELEIDDPICWEYPVINGYPPLVKLLEEKYKSPIIITNGAKQALSACFYALKKNEYKNLGTQTPYWGLIPPLAKLHDLKLSFETDYDSYLLVAPNNPDGQCANYARLLAFQDSLKSRGIPLIHDGAYYTRSYLPKDFETGPLGDLQIFSGSKMFGLSGLRIGFIVCHSSKFYSDIIEYLETTTSGISNVSQLLFNNVLHYLKYYPLTQEIFEAECRWKLEQAKNLIKSVSSDVFIHNDVDYFGMFGWFKKGTRLNLSKAKVNCSDGLAFGQPDFVRLNLAVKNETLKEVVNRLNSI